MDLMEAARRLIGGDPDIWLEGLEELGDELGYFETLGDDHSVILTDRGTTLLVTFESLDVIRQESEHARPMGFDLIKENGWSHLCLLAHRQSWFRDPEVYAYFDRLVDDGFFDEFDQVVFLGEGMCGYAAAAYSVAAPGATVIAVSPHATLDPRVTEWDPRYSSMRRTSFTDRYGYAPDMLEAADRAFVLYDPEEELDAMHAALYTRQNVTKLRCRFLGHRILQELANMDILQTLVDRAGTGRMQPIDFHRLFRARRRYTPWLRQVLTQLDDDDRMMLAGLLCRNVISRMNGPRFRRRLKAIEATLAEFGEALPPPRISAKVT